jgi:hypothetical protein
VINPSALSKSKSIAKQKARHWHSSLAGILSVLNQKIWLESSPARMDHPMVVMMVLGAGHVPHKPLV